MKIYRTTAVLVLGLVIILTAPPQPAAAISVEIGPIELVLRPGEKYFGSVKVWNDESEPVDVKIYPGDWEQTDQGELYLEVGEVSSSMTEWMDITPSQVTIPAGGTKEIYFEVRVPEVPNLSGSYWGIFFVEVAPKPAEAGGVKADVPNLGVRIIIRHGIKIYVTIPGTEEKLAKFTSARTVASEMGGLDFIATLENQGNTYLRPDAWLEIRDTSGATVYEEEYRKITLLPDARRDYIFELRGLNIPPGRYIALIIADYGAVNLVAAQAEIQVT